MSNNETRSMRGGRLQEVATLVRSRTDMGGRSSFPYAGWSLWKQHQWMILDRSFVAHLRTSPTATHVLATMEWACIPDELYFADVGLNSPAYRDRIVADNKRYLHFSPMAIHPKPLSTADLPRIRSAVAQQAAAFARKINIAQEPALIAGIERMRAEEHATWLTTSL